MAPDTQQWHAFIGRARAVACALLARHIAATYYDLGVIGVPPEEMEKEWDRRSAHGSPVLSTTLLRCCLQVGTKVGVMLESEGVGQQA